MNCVKHPKNEAVGACTYCGKFFCNECLIDVAGRMVCRYDIARVMNEAEMTRPAEQPAPVQFDGDFAQPSQGRKERRRGCGRWVGIAIIVLIIASMASNSSNNRKRGASIQSPINTTKVTQGTKSELTPTSVPKPMPSKPPEPENVIDVDYLLLFNETVLFEPGQWIRTACKAGEIYVDKNEIRVYDEIIKSGVLAAAWTNIYIKLSSNEYLNQIKEDDYFVVVGQATQKTLSIYAIENAFIESTGSTAEEKYMEYAKTRAEVIKNANRAKQEEVSAARAAYIADCEKVGYNDLIRNPDSYKGKKIAVSGTVKQIMGEGSWLYKSGYRFYEGNSSSKEWFIYYDLPEEASRILVGDKLTFYGEFNGIEKFSQVIGGDKYIPTLKAVYVK